ncbi:protein sidekick-2-like [Clytia hemisphaerica]
MLKNVLVIILVIIAVSSQEERPADVTKGYTKPIQFYETTSVRLFWEASTSTKEKTSISYTVTYCRLNFPDTCTTLESTNGLTLVLKSLNKDTYYQYKIQVRDQQNQTGAKPYENYFRTERKNSCQPGHFRCTDSAQCVFSNRTCNGIQDCGDGSDERIDAGCSAPRYAPKDVQLVGAGSTVAEIKWISVPQSDRPYLYNILIQDGTDDDQTKNIRTGFAAILISATLDGLLPNREYTIKIRAVNVVGSGIYSDPLKFKTARLDLPTLEMPKNASVTPILYQESTSIKLSWSSPTDLKGNNPSLITYQVNYCSINKKCDKFTEKASRTTALLTDLQRSHIYQFTIRVFNENMESDDEKSTYTNIFKTVSKDTCRSNFFTCTQSPQCVQQDRKCDGLINCSDRSDESEAAGCELPHFFGKISIKDVSYNTAILQFEPSRDPKQRIRGYEIENMVTKETQLIRHSTLSHERIIKVTFVGLKPLTHYEFRVRAVNPTGTGLWSPPSKTRTTAKPTPKPTTTDPRSGDTTTSTRRPKPTMEPAESSSGLSNNEKVGVAVAIILAVLLVIITVVIVTRDKSKNGKKPEYTVKQGVSNPSYVEGEV